MGKANGGVDRGGGRPRSCKSWKHLEHMRQGLLGQLISKCVSQRSRTNRRQRERERERERERGRQANR